ncbi:MAG TPA: hypothetical protein ENI23_03335 [bacterium]|nr:hypothetical protein [bacterium]
MIHTLPWLKYLQQSRTVVVDGINVTRIGLFPNLSDGERVYSSVENHPFLQDLIAEFDRRFEEWYVDVLDEAGLGTEEERHMKAIGGDKMPYLESERHDAYHKNKGKFHFFVGKAGLAMRRVIGRTSEFTEYRYFPTTRKRTWSRFLH